MFDRLALNPEDLELATELRREVAREFKRDSPSSMMASLAQRLGAMLAEGDGRPKTGMWPTESLRSRANGVMPVPVRDGEREGKLLPPLTLPEEQWVRIGGTESSPC